MGGAALDVVQQGYAAFGRQDIPGLLNSLPTQLIGKQSARPVCLISGLRRSPAEVGEFFAAIGRVEEITVFEPKEFIESGEIVSVLGYLESFALDTNRKYQTEWIHVFTVQNGKITRWRSFSDTAARYRH